MAGANVGGNETGSGLGGSDNGQAASPPSAGFGGKGGDGGSAGAADPGGAGGTSGVGGTGGTSGAGGTGGGGGAGGTDDAEKLMLFDGSLESFNSWYPRNLGTKGHNPWTYNEDGTMTVKSGAGDILTRMPFRNLFLHVEYSSLTYDYPPSTHPQMRGNSGVFLNASYEMDMVDTFGLAPADNTCGAVYAIAAPLVSACKTGGEWNVYDIEFRASVCTNGVKTTNARFVEVKLNGILVQQNVEVPRATQAGLDETCTGRGVMLQDHSTLVPVSFRNIWAIPRN